MKALFLGCSVSSISVLSTTIQACTAFQPIPTSASVSILRHNTNNMNMRTKAGKIGKRRNTSKNTQSFQIQRFPTRIHNSNENSELSTTKNKLSEEIDFNNLMVMDVVLFQRREDATTNNDEGYAHEKKGNKIELGAVQENGTVAPLSAWTLESVYTSPTPPYNEMMEFLVDEEDLLPGLTTQDISVWKVLEGDVIGYGSRQVGGGKGPGNPHGEESELLYYVDRSVVERIYSLGDGGLENEVDVVVNPDLELLW